MWLLRKFYGGKEGALPPTDPRILSMTPMQIEMEFEHIAIDARLRNKTGETYGDDSYDDYDKESDADDDLLSEMPMLGAEAADPHAGLALPKSVETIATGEWEDVEIDDFDDRD